MTDTANPRAGLIDEVMITVIPALIDAGKPLFDPLSRDVRLRLIASRAYSFGFVQNKYRVETGDYFASLDEKGCEV